jgi:hypothetical protein
MATYRILYWQEVPSQIKVEDATDDITVSLPDKFQARIDELATGRGLSTGDDYLAQWQWSDEREREGSAQAVADALRAELEAAADW